MLHCIGAVIAVKKCRFLSELTEHISFHLQHAVHELHGSKPMTMHCVPIYWPTHCAMHTIWWTHGVRSSVQVQVHIHRQLATIQQIHMLDAQAWESLHSEDFLCSCLRCCRSSKPFWPHPDCPFWIWGLNSEYRLYASFASSSGSL